MWSYLESIPPSLFLTHVTRKSEQIIKMKRNTWTSTSVRRTNSNGVIFFHVQSTDAECSSRNKLPLIKSLISRTPDRVTLTLGSVMKTDGGLDLSRTSRLLIFLMRLLMSGLYLRRIYAQKGRDGRRADFYSFSVHTLSLFMRTYDFVLQNFDGV